jgi:hypothetical protein
MARDKKKHASHVRASLKRKELREKERQEHELALQNWGMGK